MVIKFAEGLLLRIRERQKIVAERVLSGSLATYEEYKGLTGKLNGLKEAEAQMLEQYKTMFENERLTAFAERSDNERTNEETKLY